MARSKIDLVILDLMLPGEDGLQLARELRGDSDVGIIMLTGRGETVDRIIGLEMGADDYLVKPFAFSELVARIEALLRRGGAAVATTKLRVADLELDLLTRSVKRGETVIDAGLFTLAG